VHFHVRWSHDTFCIAIGVCDRTIKWGEMSPGLLNGKWEAIQRRSCVFDCRSTEPQTVSAGLQFPESDGCVVALPEFRHLVDQLREV
jgi:hypothetical protein